MKKGEETKRSILERGVAMASVVGLGGVTIGSLAGKLAMSKSGLYGHFKSKENLQLDLLRTAIDLFVREVVAPALKADRGEPRVLELFNRWISWSQAEFLPGGCIFIEAAVEFDDQPGPVRDLLVQSQRDWLATLANAARIAVEEGHFCEDLDTEQFAFEIYSIAYGYHFINRLLRDPKAEKRALKAAEQILTTSRRK